MRMSTLIILFSCNFVLNYISGVAIGSGWQAVVAYVNLAAYYIIGLPIGCVLGFKTSLGAAVSITPTNLLQNSLYFLI